MTNKQLRIGFMGTPDFALAALTALHEQSDHDVVVVYSQPPRPKGRGQQVQPSPVHAYAEAQGIPVLTPANLKSVEAQAAFAAHNLDIAIVAAYGLLLPKAILEAPKYGCLNIHASLLPRWRGASPIQQAIWAGDTETGISIMQMDEGLDTGPVIATQAVKILHNSNLGGEGFQSHKSESGGSSSNAAVTTSSTLHYELCKIGAELALSVVERLAIEGQLKATPQDEARATYAPLLKKEDGKVDWTQTAEQIDRQIRALNPWPGVWTEYKGARFKILEARLSAEADSEVEASPPGLHYVKSNKEKAGTILSESGLVRCGGDTLLHIEKLQPAGAKAMDFASALNGGYIKTGEYFS